MFLEYRKSLKLVLDSIAQLDPNFVLMTVKNLVLNTANEWRSKSFIDVENALYLLYLISEALPVSTLLNSNFLEYWVCLFKKKKRLYSELTK